MIVDNMKLADHLEYGMPYVGDANRDVIDVLRGNTDMTSVDNTMRGAADAIKEAFVALPAEDELTEIIDELRKTLDMKKKADIEDKIAWVLEMLEDKQMTMFYASEHARDVTKEYRDYESRPHGR